MTESKITQKSTSNTTSDNAMTRYLELLSERVTEQSSKHVVEALATIIGCSHVLLLKYNSDDATLEYEQAFPAIKPSPDIYVPVFNAEDESITGELKAGELVSYDGVSTEDRLSSLVAFVTQKNVVLLPIISSTDLVGVIAFYNVPDAKLSGVQVSTIKSLQAILSYSLATIFEHTRLKSKMTSIEQESEIFSRIDAELNDTIELDYVFAMLKDWALRFSNAKAATLCLYEQKTDTLRLMSDYGLRPNTVKLNQELSQEQGGITLRVAHTGRAEIVPDVDADNDYYALADGMRTQMSVPIKREEKVIGVLTLYTTKLNGFTDDHLEFVKRLSGRAGVAVDNARLFSETERESEKLSYILRNIGDNVILVGLDHKIEMINASAILSFQLLADGKHVGKHFNNVLSHSGLIEAYQKAVESDETVSEELELPNGRVYHTTIEFHENVGRVIVMQDITHYKETDRLKTELVATVSHDLKQPLAVMRGYMDLLKMVNTFDEASNKYINNLYFAFDNMQQLIDDLLDVARIEAGITLELEEVNIVDVLNFAVRSNAQQSTVKQITITTDYPKHLPTITGDPKRLEQIFNNLVGNAVKYTPPEGEVTISTELRQDSIRIFIKDNGMGIGPEDQAQIFERFYRVRRPETDSIEGTGLGLAIVKSLIEAHNGKIDLKSALNEGSTFRVTLPR